MAFELRTSIADYTNTRFPTPDLEGAMDRRKRREQMDKQLQQQKELNDLARAEKIREFNARGVQAFGADAVVTPDGTVDYQASAANQQKRQDAALMDQAMGFRTAIQPPMVDMTKGEAGFTPEMLGALGLPNSLPGEVNLEGKSPQFQAAYTKGLSEKAQNDFRLKLAKEQANARADAALERGTQRTVDEALEDILAFNPDFDIEQFRGPDGKIDGLEIQREAGRLAKANPKERPGDWRGRTAEAQVLDMIAGMPESERPGEMEKRDLISKARSGGTALKVPQAFLKDINNEYVRMDLLKDVNKRVEDYNKKYGANAFAETVGPFDNPVFQFKTGKLNDTERKQAEGDAADIHRSAEYVIQGYRNKQFGTALTATEVGRLLRIISDPKRTDYPDALRNFEKDIRRSVKTKSRLYKYAIDLPSEIKQEFIWGQPSQQAPEAGGAVNPKGADFRQKYNY
jgi:hypothetical protein